VEQVQRGQADGQRGEEQQRQLQRRRQRLQQAVGRAEHRAVAGQTDDGADEHLCGELAEVALLGDLPPDAVAVAQDALDDKETLAPLVRHGPRYPVTSRTRCPWSARRSTLCDEGGPT